MWAGLNVIVVKMGEENAGHFLRPHAGFVDSIQHVSAGVEPEQGGRGLDQGGGAGACGRKLRATGADEVDLDLGMKRTEQEHVRGKQTGVAGDHFINFAHW